MIKTDPTVTIEKVGFFNVNYRFCVTRGRRVYSSEMPVDRFAALSHESHPFEILHVPQRGWSWWRFAGEFFWTNEAFTSEEMRALIQEAAHKKARRIQRAFSIVNGEGQSDASTNRESIPDEVKIIVWQRDHGKCVKCGSQESLEYDHIIPVSKGGSNTVRNIQILCEGCNRSKGGSLA